MDIEIMIIKFWNRYVLYYLEHFSSIQTKKEDGLPYLRDKLFVSILLVTFPLCSLAYLPSIITSIITEKYVIGAFDTLALLLFLLIFFTKNLSMNVKKSLFATIFYTLSVVLLIYMGMQGPGLIILLWISVLITLSQSKRAGLISAGLNAFIIMLMMALFPITEMPSSFFQEYTLLSGITIGINLIIFNALTVFSVSFLLDHLNESFLKEKKLRTLLKQESSDLLKAKLKAEESDKLKTAFLTNMSHEIRTPMNGILGFSTLLSEPGLNGKDQQEYIAMIQKSGSRMLNIINEIIDISKIESGQMDIQLSRANINEKIEHVFKLLNPEAEIKNISLSFENGLSFYNAYIQTDGDKLYAILTNLVKNAIKYTNKGSIKFGYNIVETHGRASLLQFFVKDTGIGIPPHRQEAIFDRFVQADIADLEARQGAGLGLSITKYYVEMLGGRIWLESEHQKGSTFYFTLPFHENTTNRTKINHL
jgi:signal transduction histidine kinase